jgi:endonuclease-3
LLHRDDGVGAATAATVKARRRRRNKLVIERLRRAIPSPRIELEYHNPWQLLVATILSARSNDEVVNRVTRKLFRRFPNPVALAAAPQAEVEAIIHPTGFFHNKARAIREASAAVVERFGGEVPRDLEQLLQLPGIARKTANIVLGVAYGTPAGIFVDTHVARVARRLELTKEDDPRKVESDLCAFIPRSRWTETALRLQLHGRYVCTARSPRCPNCPLNEVCPSREAPPRGTWQERAEAERRVVESHGREPLSARVANGEVSASRRPASLGS